MNDTEIAAIVYYHMGRMDEPLRSEVFDLAKALVKALEEAAPAPVLATTDATELSKEQLDAIYLEWRSGDGPHDYDGLMRLVEAAATQPLLAKIKELQRELAGSIDCETIHKASELEKAVERAYKNRVAM